MIEETPILFSGPMVRAVMSDVKTQTRRCVKPQPVDDTEGSGRVFWKDHSFCSHTWQEQILKHCPYGEPGDCLWVRENFNLFSTVSGEPYPTGNGLPTLEAYLELPYHRQFQADDPHSQERTWRPSIHMPRWASRITLEVESVRVERLQDISEGDAKAEGADRLSNGTRCSYVDGFSELWRSINGEDSWAENPFCWVVEFQNLEQHG